MGYTCDSCGEELETPQEYCNHIHSRHNVPAGEADVLQRTLERKEKGEL